MKNNNFKSRTRAGAFGKDKASDRSDAKPFNRERRESKPYDRERRESKPYDRERRESKPFDRERRESKPFDRERRESRPFDRERRDSKPFDRERRESKPFDRERRDSKPFDRERRDSKPFDRERRESRPFDRERRDSKPFDRERRESKPFDRERRDSKPFDRERRDSKPFDRERRDSKPFNRERRDSKPFNKEERDSKPFIRSRKPKVLSIGNDGLVRLNKFIANSGICSRREADEYIQAGLVTVNGEVITQMGTKVSYNDDIRFNGERLKGEEKVYIVLNKPKDFVTTMSDPHAEKTVMDLIEGKCNQRVFPVGRLDKMTTGVLLLTNDGELAEKLTHPSYNQKKIYHVFLDKNLSAPDFETILKGIDLEDGTIFADTLSYVDNDNSQVGIEIHSGKNRIVRRIFEHLGYKIKKLDRVLFAGLTKKNLKRGQWRFLTEQEVAMLKMGSYD